jgi:hypothetical protein
MKNPVWIFPFLVFTLFVWIPAPFLLAQNTADGDGIIQPGENADEELAKAAQNPGGRLNQPAVAKQHQLQFRA